MVDSVPYSPVMPQLWCDCQYSLDGFCHIVAGQTHYESTSIIPPRGLLPLSLVEAIVIVMTTSLGGSDKALAEEHERHHAIWGRAYDGRGGIKHEEHGGLRCICGWDSGPVKGLRPWADWHMHVIQSLRSVGP